MPLVVNEGLLIAGGILALLGILIRWRTQRHNLTDAVVDSAWQTVRGRRNAGNPTEIEKKLQGITSQSTAAGKVTAAAGTVVGHFYSQAMGTLSLLLIIVGAALVAAGFIWK